MKYGPKIYGFKAFTLFKFTDPKQSVTLLMVKLESLITFCFLKIKILQHCNFYIKTRLFI